jgi:uncharacterized protein (DUF1810 family)
LAIAIDEKSANTIFGQAYDLKFKSSMTLFLMPVLKIDPSSVLLPNITTASTMLKR